VKKITRAGILTLTFVLALMFTVAFAESAAAGRFVPPIDRAHVLTQRTSIQARHNYKYKDYPIIHVNKHDLTLQKGKSYTLKASLLPGGKSVSVKWKSSNPKIAKVSNSGKVTAVAPGIAEIWVESKEYDYDVDETGSSNACYVTVPGGSKDIKPIGTSDRTFSYGKFTFTAVTSKYSEAFAKIQKSIGGYAYPDDVYSTGLMFGSKDINKAHTYIYISEFNGFTIVAMEKSPIKTNRGIMVGAKKSAVLQKYGLPTEIYQYKEDGKITYETLNYTAKATGKNLYTSISFIFLNSKDTVSEIFFFLGGVYRN
jgi:hypothetical protein